MGYRIDFLRAGAADRLSDKAIRERRRTWLEKLDFVHLDPGIGWEPLILASLP